MALMFNGTDTGYDSIPVGQIIAQASGVPSGDNPAFTAANFLAFFPNFASTISPPTEAYSLGLNIPDAVFNQFLAEANAKILQSRWHSQWQMALCWYIAHYATLYLAATSATTVPGLIAASAPRALMTAKSVDDVSSSYDTDSLTRDLDGYSDLKATIYGQQLASRAKMLGKAGMMVW